MKLTIPILIEAILHMMLGFVDVFMLSWYNDLAASGVNAANQVITSMVFLVFSSGHPDFAVSGSRTEGKRLPGGSAGADAASGIGLADRPAGVFVQRSDAAFHRG